ncbi:hypothetical protein [Streptacidiphilus albus]|uniref:hypothetical protein n=1 Tax=Streptacidiphilus albus TaxID=105425 RepID=UPI00068ED0D2|nr:hypothetical protein [Streptacidiphilus albus]
MPTSPLVIAELGGVWRRTLVREADGSTDRTTAVTWVQGPSLFGDLRRPARLDEAVGSGCLADLDRPQLLALCEQKAFAGTLEADDSVFSWVRRIDLHPPTAAPDAGTLRWERSARAGQDALLVEEGVHEDYLEHWAPVLRVPDALAAAALLEDPQEGCTGVLVRAGSWFCYARDRPVPLPASAVSLAEQVAGCAGRAQAVALLDCEVSIGRVQAEHWEITRSTLPHRVGAVLRPVLSPSGDQLRIGDADPHGRDRARDWLLSRAEGPLALLT